jgi:hypothetical protein
MMQPLSKEGAVMSVEVPSCHGVSKDLVSCSGGTLTPSRLHKLLWHLGHHGWRRTAARVAARIVARIGFAAPSSDVASKSKAIPAHEDSLNLQPGDWVEVRSESEIRAMLDADGRYKGLLWMDNMYRFCGRRLCVHKRLERMMLESDGQMRRLKNTVLLEGAMCEDLYGCDRSCFHFWREAWLKKVTDNHPSQSGGCS